MTAALSAFLRDCLDDDDAVAASLAQEAHAGVARARTETAAKRAIVALLHHEPEIGIRHSRGEDEHYVSCACGFDRPLAHRDRLDWAVPYSEHLRGLGVNPIVAEHVLRLLAQPYRNRPGFDPSWTEDV